MGNLFDLFTFILVLFPTIFSVRSIVKYGIKPFTIVQLVFFIIFALPLILDFFIGQPDYFRYPGFNESTNSNTTNIIYNIFIIIFSYLNWFIRGNKFINFEIKSSIKNFDLLIFLFCIIPFFIFLFAPDYTYYKIYGSNGVRNYSDSSSFFHMFLNLSTVISCIFSSFLIVKYCNKNILIVLFLIVIVIGDIWLSGKRTAVLLFILFLGLFCFLKFKNLKSLLFVFILAGSFFVYSNWYQSTIRDYGNNVSFEESYENIRIDFFRDQRVKMAIYSELYPHRFKILQYPGQSLIFVSTFYVPRSLWSDKPYPYAQYFTSALFGSEPKLWGWGMTTSIYDEFIANFGWIGLFFLQGLMYVFFKKVMMLKSNYFKLYFIFLVIVLFMVHIIAFIPLYLFAIIWYLIIRKNLH